MRHPVGIVPIMGATNPEHITDNCSADLVNLSRAEWEEPFATWSAVG
jgi:predicted oxidoreductase